LVVDRGIFDWDYKSNPEAPPEERLLYMLFYQMSRMCREKGAVKHDDRLDCLSQGVKYYTDAMAISAHETIKDQKREDWNDMMDAWLDDPQSAADHMVFGMDLDQRRKARNEKTNKSVPTWV
jgi:hypothetical protein